MLSKLSFICVLATSAACANTGLYFQSVVPRLADPSHDNSVVPIAVPPFSEACRAPLELCTLRGADRSSPHVGVHEKLAHLRSLSAPRNVREHIVEIIELLLPVLVARDDAAILAKNAEVEGVDEARVGDEGAVDGRRRELFEVL